MPTQRRLKTWLYTLTGLLLLAPVYYGTGAGGGAPPAETLARLDVAGGSAIIKATPTARPGKDPDHGAVRDLTLVWEKTPDTPLKRARLYQRGRGQEEGGAGILHGSRYQWHAHVPVNPETPGAPLILELQYWDGRRESRTIDTPVLWKPGSR